MGFYVNPENETKEEFLEREGLIVTPGFSMQWDDIPQGHLPVILVRNPTFTAAGIAFCKDKFKVMTNSYDKRLRTIYFVPIEKLVEVGGAGFADMVENNILN